MNTRTALLLITGFLIIGFAAALGCSGSGIPTLQASATGIGDSAPPSFSGDGIMKQDDGGDAPAEDAEGDEDGEGDEGSEDTEDGDEDETSDTPSLATPIGEMSDALGGLAEADDSNLQDALAGIADYEITEYDTGRSLLAILIRLLNLI